MMASGKRYRDATKKYDREHLHSATEAIDIVLANATAKFDETIELIVRLGIDPRKSDQMIRGTVALPSGTGRDVRIAVFAQGEAATAAEAAGAEFVGGDELAAEVEGGMTNFDVAIATPDMMPTVGKLGRVLGPRGLMPNPKAGTVTPDAAKAVEDFKGGKVEFRTDRNGNVHVPIGKASFDAEKIIANLAVVIEELERAKPASAKGRYFKKVGLASTMGPGVKIDPARVETAAD
jgi:large subunit ribosomal protein L1